MRTKNLIILFLFVAFFSCTTFKQNKVESLIEVFKKEKVPDKRETVFDVYTEIKNGKLILKGETDNPELKNLLLSDLDQFNIEDKIIVLPVSAVGIKTFGLINLSVANLRSEPIHSAELATQALFGTPVKILKNTNNWYLIQTPDKYISWIDEDGIFPASEAELNNWKNSKRIIYTGDFATIYETEKLEIPVSDATMGNILEEKERNNNILKVKFPDGRTGFTNSENWIDFNDFKNNIKPDTFKIATLARSFLGRPYMWGGTSVRAMDCSGFVKTVYFMNGIILARDASLQNRHGELIVADSELNDFQTGDLLFFGKKEENEKPEKVTHVALSLGHSEYIQASGKIKRNSFNPESSIYSEYRKNSFVRARRVIGAKYDNGIQPIKQHPWY